MVPIRTDPCRRLPRDPGPFLTLSQGLLGPLTCGDVVPVRRDTLVGRVGRRLVPQAATQFLEVDRDSLVHRLPVVRRDGRFADCWKRIPEILAEEFGGTPVHSGGGVEVDERESPIAIQHHEGTVDTLERFGQRPTDVLGFITLR